MTRLGMGIKGSVAITIITLLLVGCGNTGPDQQNVNNEGVGSNTSVNYGSQSSFDSTSNTGSSAGNLGVVEPNISIKLKSKEVQEGSFTTQLTENGEPLIWPAVNSWPDGETVLTSDDSITIPLEFTLAHPLSGKYQVTVEYDVDRSDCAEVLYVAKSQVRQAHWSH